MLQNVITESVLFIDIETVPLVAGYEHLPPEYKQLWDKKADILRLRESGSTGDLYERAGIYAEFGKVVCICVAFLNFEGKIQVKQFASHEEKKLLAEFSSYLQSHFGKKEQLLCAHNGKEFDFPYLARRILINSLPLPQALEIAGKKPWEITLLDTMELWKFGDYKSYTSLSLLMAVFNIPSPKDDIDGSDVARVYWQENDLDRIARYCSKDAVAVLQLFLCYKGKSPIPDEKIIWV